MELLQELFVTAVVAVMFSFLIAKIVSMTLPGEPTHGSSKNVDREVGDEIIMEELKFPERLEVQRLESETKIETIPDVITETVDEFVTQQKPLEEAVDSVDHGELTETALGQSGIESVVESVNPGEITEVALGQFVESINTPKIALGQLVPESVDEGLKEDEEKEKTNFEVKGANSDHTVGDENLASVSESKENSSVEIDLDDDDDWEGIEKSELDKVFAEASKFVESGEKSETSVGSDVQMELYGLHKVATEGPCREQPPMALKISARAKWNAWQKLGNISPEMAMERYIALVSDKVPGWMEEKTAGANEAESSEEANDSAMATDTSTRSSSQTNISEKGNVEMQFGANETNLTGGSITENRDSGNTVLFDWPTPAKE